MLPADEVLQSAALADVFTFTAGSKPAFRLSFPQFSISQSAARNEQQSYFKRCRPLADVDGEYSEKIRKKKRRLRLNLVTSRLSRPYSAPPTHIVDRGPSKIAVWAKQKALGKSMLRKVAIMNRIKKAAMARQVEQRELEIARQEYMNKPATAQVPRRFAPLPPSPLGLSNYDALDMEDELREEEADDLDNAFPDVASSAIYHKFHVLEPSKPAMDELDGFPRIPQPPSPPDEKVIDILREQQRQKEITFVQFA